MARFLIASWDGGGNTPPAYHLGARLRRRGHQVGMTGWPSMAGRAGAAGLFAPLTDKSAGQRDAVAASP